MIEALTALLPRVSKILIVGWRATEQHFLKLLNRHLGPDTAMAIVAGTQAEVTEVKSRMTLALPDRTLRFILGAEGFSRFTLDRGLEQFLSHSD